MPDEKPVAAKVELLPKSTIEARQADLINSSYCKKHNQPYSITGTLVFCTACKSDFRR